VIAVKGDERLEVSAAHAYLMERLGYELEPEPEAEAEPEAELEPEPEAPKRTKTRG